MPTWYYFSRPTNFAFHNFTRTTQPPKNLRSLLGLGLKFIPTQRYSNRWASIKNTIVKFKRSLQLQFYFSDPTNRGATQRTYNPKLYVASHWSPPQWKIPSSQINERVGLFEQRLKALFKKRHGQTNLLPHQHRVLAALQQQQKFLIAPCDKNLGPAIIETADYLRIAFRDHLNDNNTYSKLSNLQATNLAAQIKSTIQRWMKTYRSSLTRMERTFIKHHLETNKTPFARFYLTLKAHKLKANETVEHLKSRPIVSCPGSLLHPLGNWVDHQLQKVATRQQSYFRNSYELLQLLHSIELPPHARLFTADAVSMYTNIPTATALPLIFSYLKVYKRRNDREYPAEAVFQGNPALFKTFR